MAICVPFPLAEICALRERATKRADALPEGPQGWPINRVDPMKVLEVFGSLHVRQGWVLRAYQFRSGRDGNGFVWAILRCRALGSWESPTANGDRPTS